MAIDDYRVNSSTTRFGTQIWNAFLTWLKATLLGKAAADHVHGGATTVVARGPDGAEPAPGDSYLYVNTTGDSLAVRAGDGALVGQAVLSAGDQAVGGVKSLTDPIRLVVLEEHPATPPEGSIYKYALDVIGVAEEFTMDSDGNTVQVTGGGDLMGMDVQAVEVTLDSDGAQSWETINVTISEVADVDSYSISFGRDAFANAIRDDVGGTGNFTIYDLRARLTSTTNLEVKYWDTLQTGSSIFPIFITAKLA